MDYYIIHDTNTSAQSPTPPGLEPGMWIPKTQVLPITPRGKII